MSCTHAFWVTAIEAVDGLQITAPQVIKVTAERARGLGVERVEFRTLDVTHRIGDPVNADGEGLSR